jgi:signal transduction histidine kinase
MLAALAAAEACRIPEHPVTTLAAATLTAAVSFVVATLALIDLVRAAQDEHAATEGLARELAGARMAVSDLGAWRAEISHDARNTLAGIRAAMHTLDRHAGELDPTSAGRLRLATLAELTHLEHMLVRPHQDADNFDVADVVRTLTDVRRADGLDVEVIAPSALVYGVPGDVATALQNLLVNAAEHAPGSRVSVEVQPRPGRVEVLVCDDGPGLSPALAAEAFDRGIRGRASRGSGLGLAIARDLVRRHNGELTLGRSGHGATFVLTLAAAAPPSVTEIPAQAAS